MSYPPQSNYPAPQPNYPYQPNYPAPQPNYPAPQPNYPYQPNYPAPQPNYPAPQPNYPYQPNYPAPQLNYPAPQPNYQSPHSLQSTERWMYNTQRMFILIGLMSGLGLLALVMGVNANEGLTRLIAVVIGFALFIPPALILMRYQASKGILVELTPEGISIPKAGTITWGNIQAIGFQELSMNPAPYQTIQTKRPPVRRLLIQIYDMNTYLQTTPGNVFPDSSVLEADTRRDKNGFDIGLNITIARQSTAELMNSLQRYTQSLGYNFPIMYSDHI